VGRVPTYVITIYERYRRTDRRTDRDRLHEIARPRFALKCIAG